MTARALVLMMAIVAACGAPHPAVTQAPEESSTDFGRAPSLPADPEPPPAKRAAAPRAEALAKAREHFQRGAALYVEADYAAALAEFEAADKLVPMTAVAFNLAVCYEHVGREEDALAAYERYMTTLDAQAPRAAEVRSRIAALRAKLGRP